MSKRKPSESPSESARSKKVRQIDVVVDDIFNSPGSNERLPGKRLTRGSTARIEEESLIENRNPNKLDESAVNEESDDDGLSDYEKMRLENIRRNQAFFDGLNLTQAKFDFNVSMTPQSTSKVKQRGLARPKKNPREAPMLPTRQSLRLRNKDPDGVTLPDLPIKQEPVDEHPRKVGLLEMKPCNDVEETEAQEFTDELTVLANMVKLQKSEEKNDEVKETDVESYKKTLQRLKIREGHVAKVVPDRIFSIAFHPARCKTLVFAGDKWGKIGIWDVGSSKGDDGVYLYEPHSRPINCMLFDPSNCGKLYTASYDGTIRCCDITSATFQEVYSFEEDDYTRFMSFAFGSPSTNTMLAATDSGYVLVVDTRTKRKVKLAEQSYCLHDKIIKCIDTHPLNNNLFLTSSTDGSVAFWDIRNVKGAKSKLSSLHRTRVVTSAYFSPLTGSQVLVTSSDDYVTINQVDSSGQVSSSPKCCFRHDNQVGRWLTNFRATWDPKFDSYAVVGSMKQPRQIDIFSSEIRSSALMHLSHANLNSINSLNVFHPSVNKLAGGNSSGKVYLWTE
ncbi:WD repeat-containing protein 76 [Porites harrisoni]